MKKRIEKVVEWEGKSLFLTRGERYPVHSESETHYFITEDDGSQDLWHKKNFKVVSEREVLEFEGFNLDKWNNGECHLEFTSDIDLKKYDFKIIATPKDSPYEGKSREELIEIIKQLKLKN